MTSCLRMHKPSQGQYSKRTANVHIYPTNYIKYNRSSVCRDRPLATSTFAFRSITSALLTNLQFIIAEDRRTSRAGTGGQMVSEAWSVARGSPCRDVRGPGEEGERARWKLRRQGRRDRDSSSWDDASEDSKMYMWVLQGLLYYQLSLLYCS